MLTGRSCGFTQPKPLGIWGVSLTIKVIFVCGFLSPSYSRCVHFSFQHFEISRRERLYPPCSGQNHRYSDTLNGKVRSFSAATAPATGSAPPHPLSHQAYEVGASIWSGASRRFRRCVLTCAWSCAFLHSVCVCGNHFLLSIKIDGPAKQYYGLLCEKSKHFLHFSFFFSF